MKITVFAKKRTSKDGREFYTYLSKLTKKDGTEMTVACKFPDELKPKADECPLNIEFDKSSANLDHKTEVDKESGEVYERNTLWIKKYDKSKEKYVDKSLDDFE